MINFIIVITFFSFFFYLFLGIIELVKKKPSKNTFIKSFGSFVICIALVASSPSETTEGDAVVDNSNNSPSEKIEEKKEETKIEESENVLSEEKKNELAKKEKEEQLKLEQEAQLKKEQEELAKKEEEERLKKEQEEKDKTQTIFMTPTQFKDNFNKISSEVGTSFKINQLTVEEGSVQDTFQYQLTSNSFIQGIVNKRTGNVREVFMMAVGDGTPQSGSDMLLIMGTLIRSSDVNMKPDDSGAILKQLMGEDFNTNNYSKSTVRNGLEYTLKASSVTGIMFIISNAQDND